MKDEFVLFTPRVDTREGEKRLRLKISASDRRKVTRGPGYKGIVTDEDGTKWAVYGAPCSLTNEDGSGCYCDAIAKTI